MVQAFLQKVKLLLNEFRNDLAINSLYVQINSKGKQSYIYIKFLSFRMKAIDGYLFYKISDTSCQVIK